MSQLSALVRATYSSRIFSSACFSFIIASACACISLPSLPVLLQTAELLESVICDVSGKVLSPVSGKITIGDSSPFEP